MSSHKDVRGCKDGVSRVLSGKDAEAQDGADPPGPRASLSLRQGTSGNEACIREPPPPIRASASKGPACGGQSLLTRPGRLCLTICMTWCFPGGGSGKEPTCQCRRRKRCRFSPWVGKVPCRRKWQPTPVFLPGILVRYSPMDREAQQAIQSTGSQSIGHD